MSFGHVFGLSLGLEIAMNAARGIASLFTDECQFILYFLFFNTRLSVFQSKIQLALYFAQCGM